MSSPRPDSLARGAFLTIAMRWTDRLIGIVSTLILARLLTPGDFGIVAMASLVILLIDTLLDLGVNAALVQNRAAERADFDTAWTLRLLQSALAALAIGLACAPLAARYFADARVEPVLWIMALSVLVAGFENIGIVNFQKHLEFGREFRFFFYRRVAGFVITLALALLLRNYWAMVFGALAGRLVGVGLSYAMHDFRPRFSLERLRALWSFSQWMLVRNLGSYGAQQIDKILVGRRNGAATLGAYNLADDVAAMPVTELLAPIGRVLFPAFVQLADDPPALRRTFMLAFGIQLLVALPAGVGLALVADLAVPLLLGAQWLPTVPLLQILALISIATALTHGSAYLLLALGKVRVQALLVWAQFVLLAALLLIALPTAGAVDIATARLAVAVIIVFVFLALVLRALPILRLADFVTNGWRPIVATAVMAAVLLQWPTSIELPLAVLLLAKVSFGVTAYAAAILLLWWFSGRPDGPERTVLDKVMPAQPPAAGAASFATIDALPDTPRSLLRRAGDNRFESGPEWFALLQRAVFANDPGVRYGCVERDGACMAILPLRLTEQGRLRRLEALANFYTPLYDPPLAPAAQTADVANLLRHIVREAGTVHEMRFAPMDPDAPAYALLSTALRNAGWVPYRYFCFGNWHHAVDSDWPGYFAQRPGEVRSTVKRMGKKFAAAGGTLDIIQSPGNLEAAIAAFVEVYNASWKVPEPYPEFIPGLIRLLATGGQLRLGIARLDGRPIAAQLWSVHAGRAAIVKLAHREDSADYAAGTLLTAHLMEHVIAVDQVSEIDYLIGDDAYKRNWMSRRRERWGIVAYNPRTTRGLLLLIRESLACLIKRMTRPHLTQ